MVEYIEGRIKWNQMKSEPEPDEIGVLFVEGRSLQGRRKVKSELSSLTFLDQRACELIQPFS
jgi:hypothetical protein